MPKDEFDLEDPLELNGVALLSDEDTMPLMAECFVEEFLRLGHNHKQILALFRNPHYLGMNMVIQNKGEPFVREVIAETFARWGKPVTWPSQATNPLTPALSPSDAERENCCQSIGESSAVGNSQARPSLFPRPLGGGEGQREGVKGIQPFADFPREQLIEHDATATDPTGAPIPTLNP